MLIDRNVLRDAFHLPPSENCTGCAYFNVDCDDRPVFSLKEICERIDEVPTVNAIPTEWIEGIIRNLRWNGVEESANMIQTMLDVWNGEIG